MARWCSPSRRDRKSTRLNSSHQIISYAVFCLKKKKPPLQRRHGRDGNLRATFEYDINDSFFIDHPIEDAAHTHIVQRLVRHIIGYFFYNDTATTEIYTLSLHDALPN